MECIHCQNERMYKVMDNKYGTVYWCQTCGTLFDSCFDTKGGYFLEPKTRKENSKDILDMGIPNVCFSLVPDLDEDDERLETFKQQRIECGFDSTELWSLDCTISKFILSRLKVFADNPVSYPSVFNSSDEWKKILDKMVQAFELMASEKLFSSDSEEDKVIEEGFDLFCKYYFSLWN